MKELEMNSFGLSVIISQIELLSGFKKHALDKKTV